jgi:peptidoglycan/xylan/chitin deacetylase (PgdA/CDA1 family)
MKLLLTLAFLCLVSNQQLIEKCIDENHFALTFDDGPSVYTDRLLNILKINNVSATFFINGIHIIRNETLKNTLKRMDYEGHVIGTHTFSHTSLSTINDFNINREFLDNELMFRMLFNQRPLFWRAPYFDYSDLLLNNVFDTFGYYHVTANIDSKDWNGYNASDAFINLNGQSISFQHDTLASSINEVDRIIKIIKNQNKTFVTINECGGIIEKFQKDNNYGPFLLNGV